MCIAEEIAQEIAQKTAQEHLKENQDHVIKEDVHDDDMNILNVNIARHIEMEGSSDHSSAMMSSDKFDNDLEYFDNESFDDGEQNKRFCCLKKDEGPVPHWEDEMNLFFKNEGEHNKTVFLG